MSMILLRWNLVTGEVQYSGAGHGNFYHYQAGSKSLSIIETEGVILGIQPDISAFRNESKLKFDSGDTILLYTDGVTEARNSDGIEFGESQLKSNFLSFIPLEPKNILERIYSELKEFVKEQEQHDDITMVAVRKI